MHRDVNKMRRIEGGEAELYKRLRLAALKDAPAAFSTTYEEAIARTDESWRNQADGAATGADRAIFFACHNDTAVGLAGLYRDEAHPHLGEFIQVWLAPAYRNQGLATQLIEFAMAWARKQQFTTVKALVAKENPGVISFYKKLGFSESVSNAHSSQQELTLHL